MNKYRFFYHYRRNTKGMTIHFRGKCLPVKDVKCQVPCETKWSKRQPYLVMQGFCKDVVVENDIGTII